MQKILAICDTRYSIYPYLEKTGDHLKDVLLTSVDFCKAVGISQTP